MTETHDDLPLATDAESEHDAEIDELRQALKDHLCTASVAILRAEASLRTLAGDRVYDVEYAETLTADDIARHLDSAAFHVRAADRARELVS